MCHNGVVVDTSSVDPAARDRFQDGEDMICFSLLIWWTFYGGRDRTLYYFVVIVIWSAVVVSGWVAAA